jgi:hypothetical protein
MPDVLPLRFVLTPFDEADLVPINRWLGRRGADAFHPYAVELERLEHLRRQFDGGSQPLPTAARQELARLVEHPDERVLAAVMTALPTRMLSDRTGPRLGQRLEVARVMPEVVLWTPLHDLAASVGALGDREGRVDELRTAIAAVTDPVQLDPLLAYTAPIVRRLLARDAPAWSPVVFDALRADPEMAAFLPANAGITVPQLAQLAPRALDVLATAGASLVDTMVAVQTITVSVARGAVDPRAAIEAALSGVGDGGTPRASIIDLLLDGLPVDANDLVRLADRLPKSHSIIRRIVVHAAVTDDALRTISLTTSDIQTLTRYALRPGAMTDPEVRVACQQSNAPHLWRLLARDATHDDARDIFVRLLSSSREVALQLIEERGLPPGFVMDAALLEPLFRTGNQPLRLRAVLAMQHVTVAPDAAPWIEGASPRRPTQDRAPHR